MRINMPNVVYNQILSHCMVHLPSEACGVLLGIQDVTKIVIERFIPLSNVSMHPKSGFEIDHLAWTRLLFESRTHDQHIIGIIHSHPDSHAIPSSADLQTLWHTIPTHWILSCINKGSPILKAFSFHADGTYRPLNWVVQH